MGTQAEEVVISVSVPCVDELKYVLSFVDLISASPAAMALVLFMNAKADSVSTDDLCRYLSEAGIEGCEDVDIGTLVEGRLEELTRTGYVQGGGDTYHLEPSGRIVIQAMILSVEVRDTEKLQSGS